MLKTVPLAVAALLTGALALPPAAEARHGSEANFSVSSQFRIGDVDIALVYGSLGPHYPTGYYYRVPRPAAHRGLHCATCFVQAGYQYHEPDCPIIGAHFRAHSFQPDRFWVHARGGVPPRHRQPYQSYRTHSQIKVPPGHLPPPGSCKVWYSDRPPGHQGPPVDCRTAERVAYQTGGFVVYGAPRRH